MVGADPLAIAAWRTLGAALVLAPAYGRGLPRLLPRDALALAVAGVALALHFWTWFASLLYTSVLRSTLVVCTVPAFTAALEWAVLGVRPRPQHWIGLVVALPGLALLLLPESDRPLAEAMYATSAYADSPYWGDALALLAAALWAVYLLLSRSVRQRVDVATAMGFVCGAAALVLFPAGLASGTPLVGFPTGTWARIGLALLGPQLIGHLGFVYAVRYVPASTVSMVTLLEPVGAALLAALLLAEIPGPWAAAGAALVLVGIAIATRGSE
jgi:drug/metabolite transporter (DMT)-like permease